MGIRMTDEQQEYHEHILRVATPADHKLSQLLQQAAFHEKSQPLPDGVGPLYLWMAYHLRRDFKDDLKAQLK